MSREIPYRDAIALVARAQNEANDIVLGNFIGIFVGAFVLLILCLIVIAIVAYFIHLYSPTVPLTHCPCCGRPFND